MKAGFILRCNKCGNEIIFDRPGFYDRQWDDELDAIGSMQLGVNWDTEEVDIECNCGNKVMAESELD